MKRTRITREGLDLATARESLASIFKEMQELRDSSSFEKFVAYARSAVTQLPERDAVRLTCADGPDSEFKTGPLVKAVVSYDILPTKKVRFNVYPETENKIAAAISAGLATTKKNATDTALKFLWEKLPYNYWEHSDELREMLQSSLHVSQEAKPTSLAVGGLGHVVMQDIKHILDVPLGDVLETAFILWFSDTYAQLESTRSVTEELVDDLNNMIKTIDRWAKLLEGKEEWPNEAEGAHIYAHDLHKYLIERLNTISILASFVK